MIKRTNKLDELVKEKYDKAKQQFESEIENSITIKEQLQAYARYSGRLEGILEGLTVGVK